MAKRPAVTVTYNGKTLTKNLDYTVAYSNNINVGTAKATITGMGTYTGTVEKEFSIVEKKEEKYQKPAQVTNVAASPVNTTKIKNLHKVPHTSTGCAPM